MSHQKGQVTLLRLSWYSPWTLTSVLKLKLCLNHCSTSLGPVRSRTWPCLRLLVFTYCSFIFATLKILRLGMSNFMFNYVWAQSFLNQNNMSLSSTHLTFPHNTPLGVQYCGSYLSCRHRAQTLGSQSRLPFGLGCLGVVGVPVVSCVIWEQYTYFVEVLQC